MTDPPRPIYAIADRDVLGRARLAWAAREMMRAGVHRLQIRAKGAPGREVHGLLRDLAPEARARGVELWIDDRVDLAALHAVFGVHLGQADLTPREARTILGTEVRIGRSTHDLAQVVQADADPDVDLVAFGPVYPTRNKAHPSPTVGLKGLREARRQTAKELVAIGGIDARGLLPVLDAGADAAAMIGAVSGADVEGACRALRAACKERE